MSRRPQESLPSVPSFIRRLMPDASQAELQQATENFEEYMIVVRDIHRRLQSEGAFKQAMNAGRPKCVGPEDSPAYNQ
jgi:hypothetical protein